MFASAHAHSNSGHMILCYCNPFNNNNTNEYKMKVFVYFFPYNTYLLLLLLWPFTIIVKLHAIILIHGLFFGAWFDQKSLHIFHRYSLYFIFCFLCFGCCFDFYNYNILIPIEYIFALPFVWGFIFSLILWSIFIFRSLPHVRAIVFCSVPRHSSFTNIDCNRIM